MSAVRKEGPAARAKIGVGDVLAAVDGVSTRRLGAAAVTERLVGRPKSFVRLTTAGPDARTMTLTREAIPFETVTGRRLDGGVDYVRIRRFDRGTAREVADILGALRKNAKGLVIDLRDDPGGVLEEAVRVADHFLTRGTIVRTDYKDRAPAISRAHPKALRAKMPIVVLVNGRTASAAEVLAAALKENGRAKLIGTHTYGKGTVQTVIELEDGSALRLTVARYLTPSGRSLNGAGLRPDVLVPPGFSKDGDRQLNAATQALLYRP